MSGNGNGKAHTDVPVSPTIHVGGSNNFMLNIGHIRTVRDMRFDRDEARGKRKHKPSWSDELVGLLVDRADELNLGERELIELAEGEFRRVSDLKELTPEELGRLYEMLSAMKRPALE